jgi:hypothetical protein
VFIAGATLIMTVEPAQAAGRVRLGATQAGVEQLSAQTSSTLSSHSYGEFSGEVPAGRMITVKAPGIPWTTVAATGPGTALYSDIVRWADTIKSRPGPVLVAYHHEPEAAGSTSYGTAEEFVSAYRRVVSIFRAQGVTNVEWTLQLTGWSFRVSPGDPRAAAAWYPGDAYVDVVGGDVYNWYTCGEGRGRWMELSSLADPIMTFAQARGKLAALPEFGAHSEGRRADWIADAHRYLAAHRDSFAGAFYFNRAPTNPSNDDCRWTLTTSAEFSAFRAMAQDTASFVTD